MESFQMAAGVVAPLIVYMGIGWLVRRFGVLTREQMTAFNLLIFRLMIPLSLYYNVCGVELVEVIRPKLFLACFAGMILFAGLAWFVSGRLTDSAVDRATLTQGTFRSNFVLYGGTIAASLCGAAGNAMVGALTAVVVPTINILSVIVFERARGGRFSLKHLLVEVIRNPLVIAGMLGLIASGFQIQLPGLIDAPLRKLAAASTPVALVILGGVLSGESFHRHLRMISWAVVLRLAVIPLLAVLAAMKMGFRGDAMVAVVAVFASPTAVASAPMAQAMGGNGELAGEIVAATTICSVVSIFLFVYVLSRFGWIG